VALVMVPVTHEQCSASGLAEQPVSGCVPSCVFFCCPITLSAATLEGVCPGTTNTCHMVQHSTRGLCTMHEFVAHLCPVCCTISDGCLTHAGSDITASMYIAAPIG